MRSAVSLDRLLATSWRLLLPVFLFGPPVAAASPPPTSGPAELVRGADPDSNESEGDPRLRLAYWRMRYGGIGPATADQAAELARRLPAAAGLPRTSGWPADLRGAVPPGGSPWVSIGPSPIFDRFLGYGFSGRITSLAVDPTSPSVIYAGAANGGVWKTTDGGLHWSPMSGESTLPGLSIGSIAIDPLSPNLIYAGGGEPNGTGYVGRGVYKSSNGGASWALLGGGGNPFASPMVTYRVLVGTNHQVWVAWSGGLHRSSDGGTTWVRVKGGLPKTGAVLDLAMSADGTELLAVVQSRGLFRSADSGTTWTQITAGVPTDVGGPRARLAIAPSNRLIAYLIEGEIDGGNTYFSTNGGASWSPMNPSVPVSTTYGGYTLEVAVDPRNPNVVYAAGLDLAVNSGGTTGGTWANVRPFTHADHHAFAFPPCAAAPCPYYLGNDGGVFFLQPQGSPASVAFGDRNRNLVITEFIGGGIGVDFLGDPRAVGGAQDTGSMVWVPTDPGAGSPVEWTASLGGDGGLAFLSHNPAAAHIAYLEQQNSFGLYRSQLYGYNPVQYTPGLSPSLARWFYPVYDLDPSDEQHLVYSAGNAVWEILAPGNTFFQGSQSFSELPTALAVAASNSGVIYAGFASGHVYRTDTGHHDGQASTYLDRSSGLPVSGTGQPVLTVNALAVDPLDPNIAYAAGSCASTAAQVVFATTNGGQSWSNISGNLPAALPAFSLATYRTSTGSVVVVGTEAGVYFTSNNGQSWAQLTNGLPNTRINRLSIDRATTTVVALTAGRGAFSTNIGGGPACTYSLSASGQSFLASGGSGSVGVTAPAGCTWTAASNATWLTLTAGASGNGNGTTQYSVAANPNTSHRTGTLTVAGLTYTVMQAGATGGCTYSISPSAASFGSGGGVGSVSVTAGAGCAWTATSNASWATLTGGGSGSGNGSTTYSVAANPDPSPRSGSLTVAGQTFTLSQDPAPSGSCSVVAIDFGSRIDVPASGDTRFGTLSVTPSGCAWTVTVNDGWIDVSPLTGSGAGFLTVTVSANQSSSPRFGSFTVAGTTVQVAQDGNV